MARRGTRNSPLLSSVGGLAAADDVSRHPARCPLRGPERLAGWGAVGGAAALCAHVPGGAGPTSSRPFRRRRRRGPLAGRPCVRACVFVCARVCVLCVFVYRLGRGPALDVLHLCLLLRAHG